MRKLAVTVLALGLVLAGCSLSPPGAQARALAETCNVFKSHYATKQIEIVATWGQRSGDAELAREAARLQIDLTGAQHGNGVPVIIEVLKMTERCIQLGALPKSDLPTTQTPSSANLGSVSGGDAQPTGRTDRATDPAFRDTLYPSHPRTLGDPVAPSDDVVVVLVDREADAAVSIRPMRLVGVGSCSATWNYSPSGARVRTVADVPLNAVVTPLLVVSPKSADRRRKMCTPNIRTNRPRTAP